MSFWNRLLRRQASPVLSPPDGMQESDIALESSICTGETVIGFRSKANGRLLNAVAVHNRADIAAFTEAMAFSYAGKFDKYPQCFP